MSVTSKTANADKGGRYVSLLDQALCNGNWNDITELARKAEKHSPERKCLTIAARSEAKIAAASAGSQSGSSLTALVALVPQLEEATAVGNSIEEDAYVASVTLAKIYWLGKNHDSALRVLPDPEPSFNSPGSLPSVDGWLQVCSVVIYYIRISALTALGRDQQVRAVFQQAMNHSSTSRTPELRRWTERLLAGVCLYFSEHAIVRPSTRTLGEALHTFWAWNSFWQRSPPPANNPNATRGLLRIDVPRRQVWKRYYDLLSTILQAGLVYNLAGRSTAELLMMPHDHVQDHRHTPGKRNQRTELRRVESTYESLLLNETKFPTADETNREVEAWVEQAVRNWKIITGASWSDAEIGDGGKAGAGRAILDLLYRAAAKTFHSTAILRELFTVHTALGDFDLAMRAFDSYVDIVTKAKARAEKTGQNELGFDDDDTALQTAAAAVRILCRYGGQPQAEKAFEIGKSIQKWLAQQRPTAPDQILASSDDNPAAPSRAAAAQSTEAILKPTTLAAAYRAVGQSQAQWARFTYAADSRAPLQSNALDNLKHAESLDPDSVDTAYALALLLADTREVTSAITVLRRILEADSDEAYLQDGSADYTRQKKLIPVWHLLALCLTARDQHDSAAKMCEAAFEQFGDPAVLFGHPPPPHATSDPEKEPPADQSSRGLVDSMEPLEREAIVQIKMSQLAFVELNEGPGVAVDLSEDLLALFTRLFGSPDSDKPVVQPPVISPAPSRARPRSGGTLRSIAGSIRNRGHSRQASTASTPDRNPNGGGLADDMDNLSVGSPLAMSRTNEEPGDRSRGYRYDPRRHGHVRDQSEMGGFRNLRSASSRQGDRRPSADSRTASSVASPVAFEASHQANGMNGGRAFENAIAASVNRDFAATPDQDIGVAHNSPYDQWPPPAGHQDNPPRQSVRLPAPSPSPSSSAVPEPRFQALQQRRHKIGLLVTIWLFIAHLYLRAEMVDDAAGAISEATKHIETLETELAAHEASAKSFLFPGWGSGKSVDELTADLWSAMGELATARNMPHAAMDYYERALAYYPDHAKSIVGLSVILMDIYEDKLPAEEQRPTLPPMSSSTSNYSLPDRSTYNNGHDAHFGNGNGAYNSSASTATQRTPGQDIYSNNNNSKSTTTTDHPTPDAVNRLAARDRAYMLLSNLTRLGSGWDDPEAWYTLARAHELSKQMARAKQALWWVVELEENKPMRNWRDVASGGFTL